jgi:hypothetical protein
MRREARIGALGSGRELLLDSVGFDWGICDREWEERFDELLAFVLAAGHADVLHPHRGAPPGPLTLWARRQLTLHSLRRLPDDVVRRLAMLRFLPAQPQEG